MTYSIKDWDLHYEKADTRKCKEMKWVAIPTDTADKKYRRISKMKDGAEIFGMWLAIVEVASKMPVRGILSDNDGDLSCEDMELIGGFPASLYEKAIKRLSSPEIGWIIDGNCQNLKENDSSGDCPDDSLKLQEVVPTTLQDKTLQDKTLQDKTGSKKKIIEPEKVLKIPQVIEFIDSLLPDGDYVFLVNDKFKTLFLEFCCMKEPRKTERAITGRLKSIRPYGMVWAVNRLEKAIQSGWKGLVFDSDIPPVAPKQQQPYLVG